MAKLSRVLIRTGNRSLIAIHLSCKDNHEALAVQIIRICMLCKTLQMKDHINVHKRQKHVSLSFYNHFIRNDIRIAL